MAPRQPPRAPPAKRRKTTTQVEELKFDPEARDEWLTGFRKRKQQRIKHAQEQSAKIEKEEKVKARKEVCDIVVHTCYFHKMLISGILVARSEKSRPRTPCRRSK